jgi:hypothetical protein
MSPLEPPSDQNSPFFAYGLLKPGELAFPLLEPFVARRERAWTHGTLWLRDGIPLLDLDADRQVAGWLLWFEPAKLGEAWEAVCSFEPATQYRWAKVQAQSGTRTADANALAGRQVRRGSATDTVQEWSAAQDPAFTEGLAEVKRLTGDAVPHGSIPAQPDTPELWSSFFRLQAAYLLLWSIVERYTALRFGPGLEAGVRVNMLGDDASFLKAVADADVKPGRVIDSRDPSKHSRMASDGTGAADYFYRIRSNLSHRGKSAFQDAQLVHKAVTELLRAVQILLERQLPAANLRGGVDGTAKLVAQGAQGVRDLDANGVPSAFPVRRRVVDSEFPQPCRQAAISRGPVLDGVACLAHPSQGQDGPLDPSVVVGGKLVQERDPELVEAAIYLRLTLGLGHGRQQRIVHHEPVDDVGKRAQPRLEVRPRTAAEGQRGDTSDVVEVDQALSAAKTQPPVGVQHVELLWQAKR